jgi:hypothetical protein
MRRLMRSSRDSRKNLLVTPKQLPSQLSISRMCQSPFRNQFSEELFQSAHFVPVSHGLSP